MSIEMLWHPPTSLTGNHWRVELLHSDGSWVWHTEHRTEEDANRLANYKREYYPTHKWRVVKAFREFN